MQGRGYNGNVYFSLLSSKDMIRFHPNLVGIILKGRRAKYVKMVQVAPGGGHLSVKLCKFQPSIFQISRSIYRACKHGMKCVDTSVDQE